MRYSRQEALLGKRAQRKIRNAVIAIVGVGAIGGGSADLLARAGVKKIILIDHDYIEIDNLHRQILFREEDVGKKKVFAAKEALNKINFDIDVEPYDERLTRENLVIIEKADIVLDGTDDMEARFLINDFCLKKKKPWIHAGAVDSKCSVFVVMPGKACFQCIFKNLKSVLDCENTGILSPASNMASSLQVMEALKLIMGEKPSKDLIRFDVMKNIYEKIKVKKINCDACKGKYRYLEKRNIVVKKCKTRAAYSATNNRKIDLDDIRKRFKVITDTPIVLVIKEEDEEIIVKNYGELLFKTCKSEDKVRRIASRILK
jgi:adenylyltransferase/sulfurtransferase